MRDDVSSRLEAAADQDWALNPPTLDTVRAARRRQDHRLTARRAATVAVVGGGVLLAAFVIARRPSGDPQAITAANPPAVNATDDPSGAPGFVAYPAAPGENCLVLREGGEDFRACDLMPGPSLWKVRGRYFLLQSGSLDYNGRRIEAPPGQAVVVRLPNHEPPDVVPIKERGTRPDPDPATVCFSPSVADALATRYPWPGSDGDTGYPFITVYCDATTARVAMAGPTSDATLTRAGRQWTAS